MIDVSCWFRQGNVCINFIRLHYSFHYLNFSLFFFVKRQTFLNIFGRFGQRLPFGAQYEKEQSESMSHSWYANSTSIELMTPKNISLYACYTSTMENKKCCGGNLANQCRVKGRSTFCIHTKRGTMLLSILVCMYVCRHIP